MVIPGLFSRPGKDGGEPSYALAITRIYVSTVASVANGRRLWGIPKCVQLSLSRSLPLESAS